MASYSERPVARARDLVARSAGDEVLVYDLARHRAHRLNASAAAVWRQCDGTRDVPAIAAAVAAAGGPALPEGVVRYALGRLGQARLLGRSVTRALPSAVIRRGARTFQRCHPKTTLLPNAERR